MIRIVVVDDHPIVRQGLVAVLEDEADFQVAGTADTAQNAVTLVSQIQPDVVLLDLEMPGTGGIAAIPLLMAASPRSRVLVFTAYESEELVLGAVRAGAAGYLLKGVPAAEIVQAVRIVAAGEVYLDRRVTRHLMAQVSAPVRSAFCLTGRESQVLQGVAEGLPNKQIAQRLAISERTVKFHLASVFRKLDAENRAQAVAVAAQRGLL